MILQDRKNFHETMHWYICLDAAHWLHQCHAHFPALKSSLLFTEHRRMLTDCCCHLVIALALKIVLWLSDVFVSFRLQPKRLDLRFVTFSCRKRDACKCETWLTWSFHLSLIEHSLDNSPVQYVTASISLISSYPAVHGYLLIGSQSNYLG